MRLFSLLPFTTATLSPFSNVPILRPFKLLNLWQLFALSPRSLLLFFNEDASFSLCPVPLLPLNPAVWPWLPFFPMLLLRALLGDMTPPQLRLRPGRLLPPSPAMLLFIIADFISKVPFPRQFLRSSLAVAIITHLLGGLVMLLHLLSTIIMRLHLWHLRLRLLLCHCVFCLMKISLLLQRQDLTMSFLSPRNPPTAVPGSSFTSSWRHYSCPSPSCPGSFFFYVGPLSHCSSSLVFGAFQAPHHQGRQSLFGCAQHDPVLSSSTRVHHPASG
jgi:hypothetical protein